MGFIVQPHEAMEACLQKLGSDVMAEPFANDEIQRALLTSELPISEAILDQGVISGIGNVAKSEALYLAGIDPETPGRLLLQHQAAALCESMKRVMWNSYREGGRWAHRVYRRRPWPGACAIRKHPVVNSLMT